MKPVFSRSTKPTALRILLIDSDLKILATLKTLLESHGHEVFIAIDAATALRLTQQHKPEIIVAGIELEETSGYELAKEIRSLPAGSRYRMIALAELNHLQYPEKIKASGFDDFLLKHADKSEILSMLNHVVNL